MRPEKSLVRGLLLACFLLFPFFLLQLALERFTAIDITARRAELFESAGQKLVKFTEFNDDARFLHLLLQNTFDATVASSRLEADLSRRIARLKKAFPETFSFIFWDSTGNPLKRISDDVRFIFLLKKLHVFWQALMQQTNASRHKTPVFSDSLEKDLRMLRQFLGPFVPLEGLIKPFLPGIAASCFQMHGRGKSVFGWFTAHQNYSVQVFVSDNIQNRMIGAKALCQSLSGKISAIDFCLVNEAEQSIFPEKPDEIKSQILLNFGKLRSLTPADQLESDKHFFNFQMLNSKWWVAAVISKDSLRSNATFGNKLLARVTATVLIAILVLYCYFLVHANPINSVRWKLLLIFAYTVFIPTAMFIVTGFDYLKQRERQVISDKAVQSFQLLNSIDDQFKSFLQAKAKILNNTMDKLFTVELIDSLKLKDLKHAGKKLYQQFMPDTLTISDRSGEDILQTAYSETIKDHFLRKTVARDLLSYLNEHDTDKHLQDKVVSEGAILNYAINHQNIVPYNLNDTTLLAYFSSLRSKTSKDFLYLFQFFWREQQLQEEFFAEIQKNYKQRQNLTLVMYYPKPKFMIPDNLPIAGLSDFLEKINTQGLSQQQLTRFDGKKLFASGLKGTNLNSAVLAVLFDYQQLIEETSSLKNNLWLLALISLLMTLSLYKLLSFQLINPIKGLSTGIEMVKKQNYAYRIKMQSSNEFGKLSHSIDETLESLQELEIAKTVQNSLLPQSGLEVCDFKILAATRSMSALGGDYYDFVVDENQNLTILLADVAGHGVQAALMMAMAKSVLLLQQNASFNPETLMENLNTTFCTLRKSDIKTMMTGQVFAIAGKTSEVRYLNAGHCSPMLIADKGKLVTAITSNSMPFGFLTSRKFSAQPLSLEPGQTLVLYTDGIIECCNDNEISLGETRFKEMLSNCYNTNMEIYLENLFGAYSEWASSQQDDVTFVLINRKEHTA